MTELKPKEIAIALFIKELTTKLGIEEVNLDLLNKVVTKLAPVSYNIQSDSAFVSGKDETEINTVVKSIFIKNLGYEETTDVHETMVKKAIEKYGISNSRKYRVPLTYIIINDNDLVEDYLAL